MTLQFQLRRRLAVGTQQKRRWRKCKEKLKKRKRKETGKGTPAMLCVFLFPQSDTRFVVILASMRDLGRSLWLVDVWHGCADSLCDEIIRRCVWSSSSDGLTRCCFFILFSFIVIQNTEYETAVSNRGIAFALAWLDLHPGAASCCCCPAAESEPSGIISLSGNDENSNARRSMTFCSDLTWTWLVDDDDDDDAREGGTTNTFCQQQQIHVHSESFYPCMHWRLFFSLFLWLHLDKKRKITWGKKKTWKWNKSKVK